MRDAEADAIRERSLSVCISRSRGARVNDFDRPIAIASRTMMQMRRAESKHNKVKTHDETGGAGHDYTGF